MKASLILQKEHNKIQQQLKQPMTRQQRHELLKNQRHIREVALMLEFKPERKLSDINA